ncbi:MAG: GNAT family N-acetyltransferase [Promethearchaeota archaeon]
MELKALSLSDMELIQHWRNEQLEILRTSFPLTKEMQEQFYHEVISNRQTNARFWGIWIQKEYKSSNTIVDILIGMVGIENIQWENRLGEISLILNPEYNNQENLQQALHLILEQGFNYLNLDNIFTEVYPTNKLYAEWYELSKEFSGDIVILPNRKYWKGNYYNSRYINFNKERYYEKNNKFI